MVLNATTFIGNFSNAFTTGLIGSGGDIGMYLIGGILLIVLVICLFSIRMGLFGAIVILPPAVIILSTPDASGQALLPYWVSITVFIIVGIIVGWIMLSVVREG